MYLVGPIGPIECAATAADSDNVLAMLVRRKDEALEALPEQLDKAIARFNETGEPTDELHASRGAAAVSSSEVPRPPEGSR